MDNQKAGKMTSWQITEVCSETRDYLLPQNGKEAVNQGR